MAKKNTHKVTDENTKIDKWEHQGKGEYKNKISLRGELGFKIHSMFIIQPVCLWEASYIFGFWTFKAKKENDQLEGNDHYKVT